MQRMVDIFSSTKTYFGVSKETHLTLEYKMRCQFKNNFFYRTRNLCLFDVKYWAWSAAKIRQQWYHPVSNFTTSQFHAVFLFWIRSTERLIIICRLTRLFFPVVFEAWKAKSLLIAQPENSKNVHSDKRSYNDGD